MSFAVTEQNRPITILVVLIAAVCTYMFFNGRQSKRDLSVQPGLPWMNRSVFREAGPTVNSLPKIAVTSVAKVAADRAAVTKTEVARAKTAKANAATTKTKATKTVATMVDEPVGAPCPQNSTLHKDGCHCDSGYNANNTDFTCDKIVCPPTSSYDEVSNACVCPPSTFPSNHRCKNICPDNATVVDSTSCKCDHGFEWSPPAPGMAHCVPITCSPNSLLQDDNSCMCDPGYTKTDHDVCSKITPSVTCTTDKWGDSVDKAYYFGGCDSGGLSASSTDAQVASLAPKKDAKNIRKPLDVTDRFKKALNISQCADAEITSVGCESGNCTPSARKTGDSAWWNDKNNGLGPIYCPATYWQGIYVKCKNGTTVLYEYGSKVDFSACHSSDAPSPAPSPAPTAAVHQSVIAREIKGVGFIFKDASSFLKENWAMLGGAIIVDRLMNYVIVKTITDIGLKKAEANMALYVGMGTDLALKKFGVTIATSDGFKILPGGIKSGVKAVFKKGATQIGAKAGEAGTTVAADGAVEGAAETAGTTATAGAGDISLEVGTAVATATAAKAGADVGAEVGTEVGASLLTKAGELIGSFTAEVGVGPVGWAMMAVQIGSMALDILDPSGYDNYTANTVNTNLRNHILGNVQKACAAKKVVFWKPFHIGEVYKQEFNQVWSDLISKYLKEIVLLVPVAIMRKYAAQLQSGKNPLPEEFMLAVGDAGTKYLSEQYETRDEYIFENMQRLLGTRKNEIEVAADWSSAKIIGIQLSEIGANAWNEKNKESWFDHYHLFHPGDNKKYLPPLVACYTDCYYVLDPKNPGTKDKPNLIKKQREKKTCWGLPLGLVFSYCENKRDGGLITHHEVDPYDFGVRCNPDTQPCRYTTQWCYRMGLLYKNENGITDCWEPGIQKFIEFIFGKTLTRGMIKAGVGIVKFLAIDQIKIAGKVIEDTAKDVVNTVENVGSDIGKGISSTGSDLAKGNIGGAVVNIGKTVLDMPLDIAEGTLKVVGTVISGIGTDAIDAAKVVINDTPIGWVAKPIGKLITPVFKFVEKPFESVVKDFAHFDFGGVGKGFENAGKDVGKGFENAGKDVGKVFKVFKGF